ncbi:MAG: hypothetical protein MK078_00310 [Crocinitomicaceae bacterium]|nr:hypothetical protein [Crocinitomicaceae bacterium]
MNNLSKIGTTLTAVYIFLIMLGNTGWLGQIFSDAYSGAAYDGVFILSQIILTGIFFILTLAYTYKEFELIFYGLVWFMIDNILGLVFNYIPVSTEMSFVDLYLSYGSFLNLLGLGLILYGIQKYSLQARYFKYFVIADIIAFSLLIGLSWMELFNFSWIVNLALNTAPFVFLYMHFSKEDKFKEDLDILDD